MQKHPIRTVLIYLMAISVLAVVLPGCGDDDDNGPTPGVSPLVGAWECTAATVNGSDDPLPTGEVMTLNADGTGQTITPFGWGSSSYRWRTEADNLIKTFTDVDGKVTGDVDTLGFSLTVDTLTTVYETDNGGPVVWELTYLRQ